MKEAIKQLSKNVYSKNFFPYLVLASCALAIWYAAPYIAIADTAPLAQPEKRIYAILLLMIGYFVKIYLVDHKKTQETEILSEDFRKKSQALTGRFQGAISFLKKTVITKNNKTTKLNQLPWYLLIGSQYAGKTSLLANANVNYILSKQFKKENLQNIPSSEICDWWATRDLVILDTPSNYLFARKTLNNEVIANPIWMHFLNLLRKFRGRNALSGIVFAMSLPELMTQKNASRDRFLNEVKKRISELRQRFGNELPIYITITKCDLLPGFIEFFGDAGGDELSQLWGVTIPSLKDKTHLLNAFNQRFNALVKRINKQLIWRLHHERNPFARPYIKDFPLQVERVKENLIALLKVFTSEDNNFNLQGVYLSSALQIPKEQTVVNLQAASNTQSLQIMKNPVMPTRPFFLKQLLTQGFLYKAHAQISTHSKLHQQIAYGVSAVIVVAIAMILGNDFRNSLKQTYAIRDSMAHYQNAISHDQTNDPQLLKALPLLDALEKSANKPQMLLHFTDKAAQSATEAYHQALKVIVLAQVKHDLETYLQNASNKENDKIYQALQAYLMLGNGEHLQSKFIFSTLQNMPLSIFSQNNKKIDKHFYAAFRHVWRPMQLDNEVINHSRAQLLKLAPVELANVILKNMQDNQALVNIEYNNQIINAIPRMYTAENFQRIYDHELEIAANVANHGSWILGQLNNPNSKLSLLEQIRTLYVANYVDVWESLLANIHIPIPTNLEEAQNIISGLIDHNSPFLNLLKTTHTNIGFGPILAASTKLTAFNGLLANNSDQEDTLFKTLSILQQVNNDLNKITTSNNESEAAFNAATSHATNFANTNSDSLSQLFTIAEKTPQPLQGWLQQIGNLIWHFEITSAANYISAQWKKEVMTSYHEQIENRFPLFPNASTDISLTQFEKFLGTHGTLTQFYQKHLSAFIATTDNKLQWKKIHNQTLPLSDNLLKYFTKAAILQRLYFPNHDDTLNFKFTLQPLWVEKAGKGFQMNLNGQQINWKKGLPRIAQPLSWPGNLSKLDIQLALTLHTNQVLHTNFKGDWAWLRLLNLSFPNVVNDHETTLTFNVDGHRARYSLFTEGYANPFLVNDAHSLHLEDVIL